MNHDHYPDSYIRHILKSVHTIAVLGASPNDGRPSHGVMGFLLGKGYRVIPVNPGHAGSTILDERVYPDLRAIPPEVVVDMVDIFRRAEAVPAVVDQALAHLPRPGTIWMQLGVRHPQAAARARARGLTVIEDRCPKIEFPRFL